MRIRWWLFWTSVFFSGSCAPSEKYLGPEQSPPISHNDLKKDGAQWWLSNYVVSFCIELFLFLVCTATLSYYLSSPWQLAYCMPGGSQNKKQKNKKNKKNWGRYVPPRISKVGSPALIFLLENGVLGTNFVSQKLKFSQNCQNLDLKMQNFFKKQKYGLWSRKRSQNGGFSKLKRGLKKGVLRVACPCTTFQCDYLPPWDYMYRIGDTDPWLISL